MKLKIMQEGRAGEEELYSPDIYYLLTFKLEPVNRFLN